MEAAIDAFTTGFMTGEEVEPTFPQESEAPAEEEQEKIIKQRTRG